MKKVNKLEIFDDLLQRRLFHNDLDAVLRATVWLALRYDLRR